MRKGWKLAAFVSLSMSAACQILPTAVITISAETETAVPAPDGYWTFDGSLDQTGSNTALSGEIQGTGVALAEDGGISGGSLRHSQVGGSALKINAGLNASTDSFSLMAWVKYDEDVFANKTKIALFQQTGGGRTLLYLLSDGTYGTYINTADTVEPVSVNPQQWHHVAIVSDRQAGNFKFYINGELAHTANLSSGFVNESTDLLIGAHKNANDGGSDPVKGNVDELVYYTSAISAQDIQAIYAKNAGALEKGSLLSLIEEASALEGANGKEALNAAIAAAQAIADTDGATLEQIQGAITDLQAAMEAFRLANKETLAVNINLNQEIRTVNREMFGINHRYHNDGYSSWNASQNKIEDEFNALVKEANFGSVRYPGGVVSNFYDWKRAIGDERKKTMHGNPWDRSPIEPNFGVDEAMSWIYDDLGKEATWVYGMAQGTPEDAADLYEYLNAPNDGTNVNGGTDWAAVRAANGHEAPYGVKYFEMGNEMGVFGQNYWLGGTSNMPYAYVYGGDMTFSSQRTVKDEDWSDGAANSNGTANQERFTLYTPIKENTAHIYVGGSEWRIVDSLEGAGKANVYTVDNATGKITFGDGVNGNIPSNGAAITATYTSPQAGFNEYYQAIHATAEALGQDVQVYSNMDSTQAVNYLNASGGHYDGCVIHPYGEISPDDNAETVYEQLLGRSIQWNKYRVDNLKAEMLPGKVPVLSEFGLNTPKAFNRSLIKGMYVANELVYYLNSDSPYINLHCLIDYPAGGDNLGAGVQAVIQAYKNNDGSVDFVGTPTMKVFTIFNEMVGNHQVDLSIPNNPAFYTYNRTQSGASTGATGDIDVPTLNGVASKDDFGNTYVLLINNAKEETAVTLNIDGLDLAGKTIEKWELTSESVKDENTVANPRNVDVAKSVLSETDSFPQVTLAKNSVTGFKISDPAEASRDMAVIEKAAIKNAYHDGESFDPTGLVAKVRKDGEMKRVVYADEPEAFDFGSALKAGDTEKAFTVHGLPVSQPITVSEAALPSVDKTALKAAIAEAADLKEADYSSTSWSAYQTALNAVKAVDAKADATQDEVNEALSDLNAAKEALVHVYTVIFKDGETVLKTETVESGKAATAPAAPVKAGYTFKGWDKALDNITANTVISALWEKDAPIVTVDKAALKAAIADASSLKEADYSASSWSAYQSALNAAKAADAKADATQDEVNKALADLNAAKEALVNVYTVTFKDGETILKTETVESGKAATAPAAPTKAGFTFKGWDKALDSITANTVISAVWEKDAPIVTVDKTALKAAIAEAASLTEADYSSISWSAYQTALNAAKAADAKADATQDEVNKALSDLNAAKEALIHVYTVTFKDGETVLKTETVESGKAATAPAAPVKAGYTFKGWDKALDNITANTVISAVWEKDAPVQTVDKAELSAAIATAEKAALKEADYSASSWSSYAKALNAAKAVEADAKASQADVDKALADLNDAKEGLVRVYTVTFVSGKTVLKTEKVESGKAATAPADPTKAGYIFKGWDKAFEKVTGDLTISAIFEARSKGDATVDKAGLEKAVKAAEALKKADYTEASWKDFSSALSKAQSVLKNEKASQSAVDTALKNLETAQKALKKAYGTKKSANTGVSALMPSLAAATAAISTLLLKKRRK